VIHVCWFEAEAYCRQAVALRFDSAAAHNHLGLALAGQGRRDEARACYDRVLALQPDDAEVHNNRGILQAAEIAATARRTLAVCFGYDDFTLDLGVARTSEGQATPYPRANLAVVHPARAAAWLLLLMLWRRGLKRFAAYGG